MESAVGAARMIFTEEHTKASCSKARFKEAAEMARLSFGLSLFSCSKGILKNANEGKGKKNQV